MSMQNQLQKLTEAAAAHEGSAAVGRLKRLFDEGTFVELDRFSCDEVAIGYGTVDGSPVYAFAQNREVCCGAVGKAQAAKFREAYTLAEQNGAPVVGLFDSDGAKLGEGLDAMDALAEILLISNRISGVVPQIAVVAGACVGSAALVAANADITVAVDGADYYLKPDEKGTAAVAAADVDEAIDKVRGLLALLPSNNLTAAPAYDFDDAVMAEAADAAAAVDAIADAGSLVRLFAGECGTAALGRVGGMACGIVALTGDAVCGGAAAQIARFVRMCDAFSLPVISFVDAAGFADLGGAAKLAHTYAEATTAKVTVVTGRAYGPVYIAVAGKSAGADAVLAWPDAVISPLSPEAAVHIEWKERLAEMKNPEQDRAALIEEYAKTMCSPLSAAAGGYVTDVVAPGETKARVMALLDMLSGKRVSRLPKKHSNLPL